MSVARYSRQIRLDDLNNVHTFAVLAVPPDSRVLDLGAGDGSVARALAERGCDVTAVERDPEGLATLAGQGLRAIAADLDDLATDRLPGGAFDVVLLLDVIEHLVDPLRLLEQVPHWLAPGGRVFLSVPHVAHAAVRLALLQGRFPRTDIGLLDRTHLQFFDRAGLDALLSRAGLLATDVLTVERDLHETEIAVDEATLRPEVIAAATADPSARVYQYFVIARPGAAVADRPGLLHSLQQRLRAVEATYRSLESHASRLHGELLLTRERLDHVEGSVTRGDASAAAGADGARDIELADLLADRDTLQRQLRERMAELQEAGETIAVLLKDLAVQRGFADALAAQVPRIAARGGETEVLARLERFEAVAPTPDDAAAMSGELAEFRRLHDTLALRSLTRADAMLRRVPRVRALLRALARAVSAWRR